MASAIEKMGDKLIWVSRGELIAQKSRNAARV